MADSGVFDSAEVHEHFFAVPGERVIVIVEAAFWIRFREFTAPATAASSGGGSTSGASSTSTSSGGGTHNHRMLEQNDPAIGSGSLTVAGYLARKVGGGNLKINISAATADVVDIYTRDSAVDHSHGMAHTHSTPAHAHALDYGIRKEPMPASIDVNIGLWKKPLEGGSWELLGSISGLDQEEQYVDLTAFFNDPDPFGLYRLTFQSAPGQPNGGRLTVDVVGTMWMGVQSK